MLDHRGERLGPDPDRVALIGTGGDLRTEERPESQQHRRGRGDLPPLAIQQRDPPTAEIEEDGFELPATLGELVDGSGSRRRERRLLKAYSPFATGVRLLPVAASVAISSLVGTRLAVRVGNKLVVTTGLSLLCGAFVWISTASQASTYLEIAAQVLVLGNGMGLTSAPATEAIMGLVSKEQAGVGSAVNDATRLLGGTLGVAVIGSIAASLYAGRLGSTLPAGLPAAVREAATGSVGGAIVAAQRAAAGGLGAAADQLRIAAIQAFEHSFAAGCLVALGVAAAGALVAWFALPARPSAKGHSGSGLHATGCALQTAIAATCSRVGGPRRSGSASPLPRSSGSTR